MNIGTGMDTSVGWTYAGYIDELRMLVGTAAWTGDFTPETTAYGSLKNKVLESTSNTADNVPQYCRGVFVYDPVDAVTLNTDLIAWASRDNGTTWQQATLADRGTFSGDTKILTTDDIDVFNVGSGVQVRYKLTTHNDKELEIHGAWLQWR